VKQSYPLPSNQGNQPFAVLTCRPDELPRGAQLGAFGRLHVEDVGTAESEQNTRLLPGHATLAVLVLLAPDARYERENANSLLTFLQLPAELIPCVKFTRTFVLL
jgi:hypothetical protein